MRKASFGLLFSLSLVVLLLAGGCATTKDLEQLRSEVQQVAASAASAKTTADAAMKEAAAARAAAERAEKAAMDAKAASEATDAKLDNMFKKSMQKSG